MSGENRGACYKVKLESRGVVSGSFDAFTKAFYAQNGIATKVLPLAVF